MWSKYKLGTKINHNFAYRLIWESDDWKKEPKQLQPASQSTSNHSMFSDPSSSSSTTSLIPSAQSIAGPTLLIPSLSSTPHPPWLAQNWRRLNANPLGEGNEERLVGYQLWAVEQLCVRSRGTWCGGWRWCWCVVVYLCVVVGVG